MPNAECPYCGYNYPPINDIINLPEDFRPHPGFEVRIIKPSAMRKLACLEGDRDWNGVCGAYPIANNGGVVEQKFIFLTKQTSRASVAHEIGHAVRGHCLLPQNCWRDMLVHELEAWRWAFTRKRYRESPSEEWNMIAHVVYNYMDASGASPKIAVREAKVVLNRMGWEVPKRVWSRILPWLTEK